MLMRSQILTSVTDFHSFPLEMQGMDNELPILIYLALKCRVSILCAELQFLEDFIKIEQNIDFEKRIVTNLKVPSPRNKPIGRH